MENTQQQHSQLISEEKKSLDTSMPGREEEVLNNEDQLRRTNTDTINNTAGGEDGMKNEEENEGRKQGQDQENIDEETNDDGIGDNDNRNNTFPPEIGKEDAEKTIREAPKM